MVAAAGARGRLVDLVAGVVVVAMAMAVIVAEVVAAAQRRRSTKANATAARTMQAPTTAPSASDVEIALRS